MLKVEWGAAPKHLSAIGLAMTLAASLSACSGRTSDKIANAVNNSFKSQPGKWSVYIPIWFDQSLTRGPTGTMILAGAEHYKVTPGSAKDKVLAELTSAGDFSVKHMTGINLYRVTPAFQKGFPARVIDAPREVPLLAPKLDKVVSYSKTTNKNGNITAHIKLTFHYISGPSTGKALLKLAELTTSYNPARMAVQPGGTILLTCQFMPTNKGYTLRGCSSN
ncbi:hypothetical protein BJI67_16145 (plasmid) [Acidihalobacter aeolianus]|uniref:Lipoprotein n=1 Tax=Acidihalobacter aeolianus TaxID=2792603 RepID=A0A1D8KCT4_9GAMM|nr:hypothetical protein [Acidihalobacter aeolianus]AOV18770.1 hypothetical protein BJI67_16145 [Acidihalobacter aeolianus]